MNNGNRLEKPYLKHAGLLQKEGRGMCHLKHEGEPVPWVQIAKWLSEEEGQTISRQVLQNQFRYLVVKVREKLLADPVIRDWLYENDLGAEWDKPCEDTSAWEENQL